ncbi:hypothetical protein Vadar_017048 [Vaccinium darrowii]|uniref:Uncharacterized protein n=1 Tax=Vaccinium darrowii TaxID=229202 RepID=A0ACB7X1I1_9ERIC|nr:hypothetical protein Vadar_017048 [Vaccinium darrowii]
MMRYIHTGLFFVQENAAERPTMGSVVVMLSSSSLTLSVSSEPGFFQHSNNSENELLSYFCNYTSSDTYKTNRDTLLSSLSAGINQYGFYSSSYGEDSDTVYAMVLCRADVELDLCRECIDNAIAKLELCPDDGPLIWLGHDPSDKFGIVWYDNCTVKYSSKVMEGIMAGDPRSFLWAYIDVTIIDQNQFTNPLRNLLNNLRVQAAEGGTQRKFASGSTPIPGGPSPDNYTIYALTQCTPDLSTQDCSDCLEGVINVFLGYCDASAGGRGLSPSCNFRYEIRPFFGEIPSGIYLPYISRSSDSFT